MKKTTLKILEESSFSFKGIIRSLEAENLFIELVETGEIITLPYREKGDLEKNKLVELHLLGQPDKKSGHTNDAVLRPLSVQNSNQKEDILRAKLENIIN